MKRVAYYFLTMVFLMIVSLALVSAPSSNQGFAGESKIYGVVLPVGWVEEVNYSGVQCQSIGPENYYGVPFVQNVSSVCSEAKHNTLALWLDIVVASLLTITTVMIFRKVAKKTN